MNRHFEDTAYYLKRAAATAKKGVWSEVEPVEERVRELTGREKEPEPSRVEAIRADLAEFRAEVEDEVLEFVGDVRAAVEQYRPRRV